METAKKTELLEVIGITDETPDIRTLKMRFAEASGTSEFKFLPGQMAQYSVFGQGEYTLSIVSSPAEMNYLECSFRLSDGQRAGLKKLRRGDLMALSGPYGNAFPIEYMKGKNILLIADGIGLTSLRSLIWHIIESRSDYGNVTIIYGANQQDEMLYKADLLAWQNTPGISAVYTVNECTDRMPGWIGETGKTSAVAARIINSSENSVAVVCGSSKINDEIYHVLMNLGFDENNVFIYLDNKSAALSGNDFQEFGVVTYRNDGPVYSYRQLKASA